jgi:hypothetical protein
MLEPWVYENYSLSEIYTAFENNSQAIDYSRVNITDGRRNIPVGLILFEKVGSSRSTVYQTVDYSSQLPIRRQFLIALIESSLLREHGLFAFSCSLRSLKDFLEFSSQFDTPDEQTLLSQFECYCEHLREQVRLCNANQGVGLKTAHASRHQRILKEVVTIILGEGSCAHIPKIKINRNETVNTVVPNEVELGQHLTHYTELFDQFTDRLLGFEPLPWAVRMYGTKYFVFPYRGKLVSLSTDPQNRLKNPGFNYDKGELNTKPEIREILKTSPGYKPENLHSRAVSHFKRSERQLADANSQPLSFSRRVFASIAIRAYLSHFLILTGMNDSVAATLKIDQVEVLPGKRKFKNIKLRAGGVVVEFEMQSLFVSYFKKFINLRNFVLSHSGQQSNMLFVEVCLRNKTNWIRDFTSNGTANHAVRMLDPFNSFLPIITTREYRLAKGQWICEKKGVEAASFALQHSIQTNIKSYNEASQSKVDKEVTHYFARFNSLVLRSGERADLMETEVGSCINPNLPKPAEPTIPQSKFTPDCRTQEGCLFCDKYAAHADEQDLRKLFSIKFIVYQYKNILDVVSFDAVFSGLLSRIVEVIQQIRDSSLIASTLADKIEEDVFENEALSHYWLKKYEMLDELGLI